MGEIAVGDDTRSCHVVYVGNRGDAPRILAAAQKALGEPVGVET